MVEGALPRSSSAPGAYAGSLHPPPHSAPAGSPAGYQLLSPALSHPPSLLSFGSGHDGVGCNFLCCLIRLSNSYLLSPFCHVPGTARGARDTRENETDEEDDDSRLFVRARNPEQEGPLSLGQNLTGRAPHETRRSCGEPRETLGGPRKRQPGNLVVRSTF